ncbi:Spore protein SP21 [bacterium HR19]|nr:Spore protein SP21 [bacterium HR19]
MERKKGLVPRNIIESIEKEIERAFEDFFGGSLFPLSEERGFYPSLEVLEDDNNIIIRAEVPGLTQKDISVDIQDNVLTIKGEKKVEEEFAKKNVHISERRYGKFIRRFSLPDYVEPDKAKAKLKDGVLTITIPKKEEKKPKSVSVSIEE